MSLYGQQKEVYFEHITIEDGLSQSSVKAVGQDSRGFLWFGTLDGLNRYDGYSFKIYRKLASDINGISSSHVMDIHEDSRGNLWAGTNGGGLNRYNNALDNFYTYRASSVNSYGLRSNHILEIFEDADANLWVTTYGGGLAVFDYENDTFRTFDIADKKEKGTYFSSISTLYQTDDGWIWAGFESAHLAKFRYRNSKITDLKIYHFHEQLSGLNVKAISQKSDDELWLGSSNGLLVFNTASGNHTGVWNYDRRPWASNPVYVIFEDDQNRTWFGSSFGIYLYEKDYEFVNYHPDKSADNYNGLDRIRGIHQDRNGILWFGTDAGILKYVEQKQHFRKYQTSRDNNKSSDFILASLKDSKDNLWFGTYGGGLTHYNTKTGRNKFYFKDDASGISSNIIISLYESPAEPGIIWIGTHDGGLNRLNTADNSIRVFSRNDNDPHSLSSDGVRVITEREDGKLYLGTSAGLDIFDRVTGKAENLLKISQRKEVSDYLAIYAIYQPYDEPEILYLGSFGKGLIKFNTQTGNYTIYSHNPEDPHSITNDKVISILEDSMGRLWLGTYGGGLNLFNRETEQFKAVTYEDGLPNDVVYGVLEDSRKRLWLSTNEGLCRYIPDADEDIAFKVFDEDMGLPSDEFNRGAYYQTDEGEFIFGTVNGAVSFYPDSIDFNSNAPPVVLTNFSIFNKKLKVGEDYEGRVILDSSITEMSSLKLNYDDYIITIEFAALDYLIPENNQYAYILEGYQDTWARVSEERRFAVYTNLPSGDYVFRVKAANSDGIWNETGASLSISITPPFWDTWWFMGLIIFAVTGLIFGWIKMHNKNLAEQRKKLQQEVEKKTTDLKEANAILKLEIDVRKKAENDISKYIDKLERQKEIIEMNASIQKKLNEELQNSEKQLKEMNASKDKFFSIIAHDLRSPFTTLLGVSEMLIEDYEDFSVDEIKQQIEVFRKTSKNIYNLLENLLNWSRIQTGRMEFSPELFDLKELADRVIRLLIGNAQQKNITLISGIPDNLKVFADKNMIETIIRNLVSNAVKFTRQNGNVEVKAKSNEKFVKLSVTDTGVGMTPDVVEQLFRIDVNVSREGTDNEKGTGIGLILCKELIEKNGGTIQVQSELDKGSKFTVTIPKS